MNFDNNSIVIFMIRDWFFFFKKYKIIMEFDSIGDLEFYLLALYYFDENNQMMVEKKHIAYNNDD